jgi:uncharacterized SAM-dependent methyltransferase
MATRTSTISTAPQFAEDVRTGLTRAGQKELPSKYLYDEVGSALFEVITLLSEYCLTRAKRAVQKHAEEIVRRLLESSRGGTGSGSGETRYILEAVSRIQPAYPISFSRCAGCLRRELAQSTW